MSTADDPTSRLIAAAFDYQKRGWRVLQLHHMTDDGICSCFRKPGQGACKSIGKHPVEVKWQSQPALSAADIHTLWDESPRSNVGLATGHDFWVLDIDPKDNGFETMKSLVEEHGKLPETFTVRTGSGGLHYYFALPDFELRNTSKLIGPGVDTRASGGQVVAAPSVTDKGVYTVIRNVPVVQAPAWLLEMARKKEVDGPTITTEDLPRPEDIEPGEWERLTKYAKKAIESELKRLDALKEKGWEGDPWNHTSFQVACSILEFANSPWNSYSVGQAMEDFKSRTPRDNDGFDGHAVAKIWGSAVERIGNKARAIPESQRSKPEEEDDVFSSPDIEDRSSNPPGGGEPKQPRRLGLDDYFGGEKGGTPLYANMARGVLQDGPLAWGRDEAFWSYANGVWTPDREVVTKRMVTMLDNAFRTAHVTNVTPVVKHQVRELTGDPLESHMNFKNGMLDWRSGDLVEHAPDFNSTVQFPFDWNPDAECPHFDDFLADVMHEDYVDLAWEMLGYLLYSGNPLQVAFLFYGSGGNGKGTLMRVIEQMLGMENISTESLDDLNGNRFSAVNLFGRLANIAGDIDGTYQESTANFKKLTGEDTYAGERKFGDRFTFVSWAVPVFSANKIPGSADVTEGYLRRWIILHFHKRITNVIPSLSDRLAEEIPGIAAKAVRSLRTLMDRERFDPQGEAIKGKEMFADNIDQVRQWINSGDPIKDSQAITPATDLYASYKTWAEGAGQGRLKLLEFGHRLEAIGYPRRELAGRAYHQGLTAMVASKPTKEQVIASFFDNIE